MLGPFAPGFSGRYTPATLSPTLLVDLARRVRAGELLPHAPPARNRYEITRETATSLRVVARGWLTHAAVGLNDLRLEIDPREQGTVRYDVGYGGWAKFVVLLSLCIIVPTVLIVLLAHQLLPEQTPVPRETNAFLWPMAIFWGLIWPWLLVAMHKPMARRVLLRLLDEVNGGDAIPLASLSKWRSVRRQSPTMVAGWPLWCIALGPDRESGALRGVARGWIAVGDIALGGVAIGGVAVGVFAVGGLAFGALVALGGAALGGVAIGGVAVGVFAVGGLAVGWWAVGGAAIGVQAVGGRVMPLGPVR